MVDDKCLREFFPRSSFPALPCPSCGASLQLDQSTLKFGENAKSSFYYEVGAIEDSDRHGVFAGLLVCASGTCREPVSVLGESFSKIDDSKGAGALEMQLQPRFFHPAPPLFSVPGRTPRRVAEALRSSFTQFWSNPSAAGNALRIAVEHLMDHEKVPQFPKGVRKESKRLTLHSRIEAHYAKKHAERAGLLLAIKWIGNAGSHKTTLTRSRVVQGYKIFEAVLDDMFDDRREVTRLAKRIVRTRGRMRG